MKERETRKDRTMTTFEMMLVGKGAGMAVGLVAVAAWFAVEAYRSKSFRYAIRATALYLIGR